LSDTGATTSPILASPDRRPEGAVRGTRQLLNEKTSFIPKAFRALAR
jgi:hypothetical protein